MVPKFREGESNPSEGKIPFPKIILLPLKCSAIKQLKRSNCIYLAFTSVDMEFKQSNAIPCASLNNPYLMYMCNHQPDKVSPLQRNSNSNPP